LWVRERVKPAADGCLPAAASGSERAAHHAEAVRGDVVSIVSGLQAVLGREVVAMITGRDPRQVSRWIAADAKPPMREMQLIRDTYQIGPRSCTVASLA